VVMTVGKQADTDMGASYHFNPLLLAPLLYENGQKAFGFAP